MGTFPQYDHPHTLARYCECRRRSWASSGKNDEREVRKSASAAIDELKEKVGIKNTIRDYGVDEKYFLDTLDEMVEQAFDDQCTGANPRYPLMKRNQADVPARLLRRRGQQVRRAAIMKLDKVIAVRTNKTVYRDGHLAIKVFDSDYSKADVLNEALNQARVEETGLNIPRPARGVHGGGQVGHRQRLSSPAKPSPGSWRRTPTGVTNIWICSWICS